MTYKEALNKLLDGNKRYIAGTPRQGITAEMRANLVKKQHPYAVIIGCSDSRVPVELIFDVGPGELFVIRTAGNVAGPLEIGSIEFAVKEFKAHIVVVLGHQHCGAVHAAVDGGDFTPSMQAFLKDIRACVPTAPCDDPYKACEDEHIRRTVAKIAADPLVSKAVQDGIVHLCAAKYSLETGKVTFF